MRRRGAISVAVVRGGRVREGAWGGVRELGAGGVVSAAVSLSDAREPATPTRSTSGLAEVWRCEVRRPGEVWRLAARPGPGEAVTQRPTTDARERRDQTFPTIQGPARRRRDQT